MGPGSYVSSTANYYNAPKRGLGKKAILLLVAALVIIATLIIVIVSMSNKDNIGTQSQHLSAQLSNLTVLTTAARSKIGSGDLKKLNAETSIIIDGVESDLATTLPKKIDKSILADESDATSNQSLSDAQLAGTYDATYKTVLKQKLENVTALLSEIYNKTKNPTLKATLDQNYKDLQAILTNLNKLG